MTLRFRLASPIPRRSRSSGRTAPAYTHRPLRATLSWSPSVIDDQSSLYCAPPVSYSERIFSMVLTNVRNCVVHMSLACLVAILSGISSYVSAQTGPQAEVIEHAKRATVGILEDTQDPRTPDKPGKIKIRGTGFHLHDGYIVTARHAVEKTSPAGHIVPKVIHILTTDLHELVAQIVGESAYLD